MIKYRTKALFYRGVPVMEALRAGALVEAHQVERREAELSPRPVYNVWNCRVGLAFEVDLGSRIEYLYPPNVPPSVLKAAEADIYAQGGALNLSGIYPARSRRVWTWAESKRAQAWLSRELLRLGLEVVDA
jgi:hypothetical protein